MCLTIRGKRKKGTWKIISKITAAVRTQNVNEDQTTSAEAKNAWSSTSTPSILFHGVVLN